MSSIRKRLLVLLLGSWTTVWLAVAVTTFERSGHEVEELLDAQLAQTAQVLCQITRAGTLPDLEGLPPLVPALGHHYESKIAIQLWRDGALVSRFGGAPPEPLADTVGFSDRHIGQTQWRVYGLSTNQPGVELFVGQSDAIRHELVRFLTLHALQPILWSLPLTLVLIWLAVSDGLRPLRRLAGDIDRRSAERLLPIDESDIPSEIQALTTALNHLLKQLERALSAERRFAADASHELRTPLAVIRTQAQIARRSQDPAERTEALDALIQSVDRAAHRCSQLLALARLDRQGAEALYPAAPLADALSQTLEDKAALARDRSVSIGLALPEEALGRVAVEPDALEVLLSNLVDNAIKYTPPGGEVRISGSHLGNRVVLRVTDSGPGIPPADRDRVLQRFYRRDVKTAPGAGLGLSIVQRICELYGAEIALLDGDDGRGLCVEVAFPSAG